MNSLTKPETSSLSSEFPKNKIFAVCALKLRKLLETDDLLKKTVAAAVPAISAKQALIDAASQEGQDAEVLSEAAEDLLNELEQQRKNPPSLYLVSQETGKSIMPISASDIYTPPDYVGLDGKTHKSAPILHPGITSSLAVSVHEAEREKSILSLAGDSPAYKHLSDPSCLVSLTEQKLTGKVELAELPKESCTTIKFGVENSAGVEQSINESFHRAELYSALLAKKIVSACGGSGRCQIVRIDRVRGAKQHWYEASVKIDRTPILSQ